VLAAVDRGVITFCSESLVWLTRFSQVPRIVSVVYGVRCEVTASLDLVDIIGFLIERQVHRFLITTGDTIRSRFVLRGIVREILIKFFMCLLADCFNLRGHGWWLGPGYCVLRLRLIVLNLINHVVLNVHAHSKRRMRLFFLARRRLNLF